MRSFAVSMIALLPAVALAGESGYNYGGGYETDSTLTVTSTVQKVNTITVTAPMSYGTPTYAETTPTVYTSEAPTYYQPQSSSEEVYVPMSSETPSNSVYVPTYPSTTFVSQYQPTGTGGNQYPTTSPTGYNPPSPTTQAPAPTGAAGKAGANVLIAGVVAGVGAMML